MLVRIVAFALVAFIFTEAHAAQAQTEKAVHGSVMGDVSALVVVPLGVEAPPLGGMALSIGYQPAPFWALTGGLNAAGGNGVWISGNAALRMYVPGTGIFAAGGVGYATTKVKPALEDEHDADGNGFDTFAELGFVGAEDGRGGPFLALRLDAPLFQLDSARDKFDPDQGEYVRVDTSRYCPFLSLRVGMAF